MHVVDMEENEKAAKQNKTYKVHIMLKHILMYLLKCGCGREAGFEQNEFAVDVTDFCTFQNACKTDSIIYKYLFCLHFIDVSIWNFMDYTNIEFNLLFSSEMFCVLY